MALRAKLNALPAPAPAVPEPVAPATPAKYVAPSRRDRAQVVCFVDRATKRQLDQMAFEQDRPIQAMMVEALDLLFQKHARPRIAESGAKGA